MKRRTAIEIIAAVSAAVICLAVWITAGLLRDDAVPEPRGAAVTVVLDPGHGGEYPGCVREGVYEKDITLSICLALRDRLEEAGVEVIMTREDDSTVSLGERCETANASDAVLFVSIHANSFDDADISGFECYYYERPNGGRAASDLILSYAEREGIKTRYSREGDYQVVRETTMPAVLIETGYMTNPEELRKLQTEEYREKLVSAVAGAVIDYTGVGKGTE